MRTMSIPDLTPAMAALARERTYRLFSQLYLRGLSSSLLPLVRALPGLAEWIPAEVNEDMVAADHHHLFRFNLFPYQSIFLDAEGLLGGAESDRVRRSYRLCGFAVEEDGNPDHIGHELNLMAFLCGAERDAWEDGEAETARHMRQRQRDFLQSHLLLWIFPLTVGVRRQGQRFYGALADLTLELIHDHALALERDGALPEATAFRLPDPPALLKKNKTGLKEIAAYLVTPPYAGLFISRDAIGQLGRELEIPRGFGDRQQTLVNLMRSAAQYDAFPALLEALQEMVREWAVAYSDQQDKMPELAPFCRLWQARVEKTARLLANMQSRSPGRK